MNDLDPFWNEVRNDIIQEYGGELFKLKGKVIRAFLFNFEQEIIHKCEKNNSLAQKLGIPKVDGKYKFVNFSTISESTFRRIFLGQSDGTIGTKNQFVIYLGSSSIEQYLKDKKIKFKTPSFPKDESNTISIPAHQLSNYILPAHTKDFEGRITAIELIKNELQSNNTIITISGMGGSGKTQLAIKTANDLIGQYKDGVLFIDMLGTRSVQVTPDEVAQNISYIFNPIIKKKNNWLEHYKMSMAGKEMLIVLDNVKDQFVLKKLIPPKPVDMIVTSRRKT